MTCVYHSWTSLILYTIMYIPHAVATPSAVASFGDARCTAGGVCPNDPLVFTCEVNNTYVLRVVLPTGYHEYISVGDTTSGVSLPDGFTADSLLITPHNFARNTT